MEILLLIVEVIIHKSKWWNYSPLNIVSFTLDVMPCPHVLMWWLGIIGANLRVIAKLEDATMFGEAAMAMPAKLLNYGGEEQY